MLTVLNFKFACKKKFKTPFPYIFKIHNKHTKLRYKNIMCILYFSDKS